MIAIVVNVVIHKHRGHNLSGLCAFLFCSHFVFIVLYLLSLSYMDYLFSDQMIIHNLLTAFNQYLDGFYLFYSLVVTFVAVRVSA